MSDRRSFPVFGTISLGDTVIKLVAMKGKLAENGNNENEQKEDQAKSDAGANRHPITARTDVHDLTDARGEVFAISRLDKDLGGEIFGDVDGDEKVVLA